MAVIGAGGIGFDVTDFLTHGHVEGAAHAGQPLPNKVDQAAVRAFLQEWGVDGSIQQAGGLKQDASSAPPARQVYMLQRKSGKLGMGLGKTTGWIHRTVMKKRQVVELSGCSYDGISDEGLHITQKVGGGGKGEKKGDKSSSSGGAVSRVLAVDTVVLCAGQESLRTLEKALLEGGRVKNVFTIGGAQEAGELDAKRAIDQVISCAHLDFVVLFCACFSLLHFLFPRFYAV